MTCRASCLASTTALLIVISTTISHAEPKQPDDIVILRHLYREVAAHRGMDTEPFGSQFCAESGRIARSRGPHILHALFRLARTWHDEEVIAYLPLIVQLERRETLRILSYYERHQPDSREFVQYLRGELWQYDASHAKSSN